ncbi:hypothetical protein Dimus_028015 [Dionaea muscipula]
MSISIMAAAFSILKKILVIVYLVHHTIAATKGSYQLVNNTVGRTARISRNKSSTPHIPTPFRPVKPPPPPSPLTPLKPPIALAPLVPVPVPTPPAPAVASPPSSSSVPNQQLNFSDQRLAVVYPVIQRFKISITSDPLNITGTWVGADICNYTGFYCSNPPDNLSAIAVASIDFNGYHLGAPTLDGFLDQLPDLALFHANSNNFSGIISPNIAKLPYLYELDISNNIFSGPFPAGVVGLNGLVFLDIRFNMFSGSVPPAIFSQDQLEVLFLNDNSFMSSLPVSLGSSHILYLTLADNKFTGPIPSDIAKVLSNLTEVLLLNNQFIGCLPYQLGLLTQVTLLDVSENLLTGPLPFSFGCLQNAQVINFAGNLLYGMVPDLVCQLPNLANLTLSNNYFTHVGVSCRNLIRSGVLDVTNNCIPGLPFQRSVIECIAFFAVPRICPYMETYSIIPCKLLPPHPHILHI